MFGQIRASPSASPPECLGMEGPPAKILKDDSLSVYESTIMKLKQGSRRRAVSPEQAIMSATVTTWDQDSNIIQESQDAMMTCETDYRNETVSASTSKVTTSAHGGSGTPSSLNGSDCSLPSFSSAPSPNSVLDKGRSASILDLFSKYQRSHCHRGSESPDKKRAAEEECLVITSTVSGCCEAPSCLKY